MVRIGCVAPCMLGHLHVGMTSIQNGGYFWLKTNYLVYLCCLEFLSGFNDPSFFLGRKALPRSPFKVAKIACSTSQNKIKMATLRESAVDLRCLGVSRHFSHQAIFLSLKIPLARLTDISKVVNRNRRPRRLFDFFFLSSFSEPSAVLSEAMTTKPTQTHVYISEVVHLLAG